MYRPAGLLLVVGACTASAPSGPGPGPDAPPPTPALALSTDASIPATDLGVDAPFLATLTSTNGFAGEVTVSATAPTGWNVSFDETLIDVPANGTATAHGHLIVDGDADLAAQITISVDAGDTPVDPATIAATANPTLTVTWKLDAAMHAVYDPNHLQANPYKLKGGRTIKVVNGGDQPMTVHVDGITGFTTETTPTAPNDSYARIATTPGDSGQFYWDTLDASPTDESTHPHLTVTP